MLGLLPWAVNTRLPLIDLHRHLDGSIRLETILDLGRRHNIPLPAWTTAELRPHVVVTEPHAALVDFGIPKKGGAPSLQQSAKGVEISSWSNPEAPVSWSFSGLPAGDYEVLAEISGLENTKATLEIGPAAPALNVDVSGIKKSQEAEDVEQLPVSFTATGDYHKFETQNLGKIEIEEAGEMTLTIRPDLEAWKPVNLKKVILRPAK
jgi:hypothetical protein